MELNFVLGGRDDWQYKIQLEAGDTIYLCTDVVTDAANSAGKMYLLERLQKFLNELDENLSTEEILSAVRESLQKFFLERRHERIVFGLRAILLATEKTLRRQSVKMKLLHVNSAVKEIIRLVGFLQVIHVED